MAVHCNIIVFINIGPYFDNKWKKYSAKYLSPVRTQWGVSYQQCTMLKYTSVQCTTDITARPDCSDIYWDVVTGTLANNALYQTNAWQYHTLTGVCRLCSICCTQCI